MGYVLILLWLNCGQININCA